MTATEPTSRNAAHSQSLERGLEILSAFHSGQRLLGVSDISRAVGLSRSTAHRYIATLTGLGYLAQDPFTRKYRLGPRVLDLGFSAIDSLGLREHAAPHLQELSDATGHTVNMAVLDGAEIVYVDRCRTSQRGQRDIDLNLHTGSRLPAYCTSMGKVLLAYLEPAKLRDVLKDVRLDRRGPNTLTDETELLRELERVRAAGLAVNNEELAYSLRSIAAPVRGSSGEVVAAINLAVHRSTISLDSLLADLGPQLKRTAAAISAGIAASKAAS